MSTSSGQVLVQEHSIRDNRTDRGTVGEFLTEHIVPDAKLFFVSAYFTIYAYEQLRPQLEGAKELNFLFGEPSFLRNVDPSKTAGKNFAILQDDLKLATTLTQKRVAKECAAWMRDKVNIRSFIKPNFLHGKLYYIDQPGAEKQAVTGSSNFTVRGLGFGSRPNIELNMVVNDRRDLQELKRWFDELWGDLRTEDNPEGLVEDVKEQVLNYLERLHKDHDPEFIYFKTLYHLFEQYIRDQEAVGDIGVQIGFQDTYIWRALHEFQRDGVKGAIKKIEKHNGCIIADSVGLGKTFEALAVIKYFELRNLRVLVLCPKKLRDNWDVYRQNDTRNPFLEDRLRYDVLSHTDLGRKSGQSGSINLATFAWSNYDLIVIDESHNFRNNTPPKTTADGRVLRSRYHRLLEDVLQKGASTKVLLLSATPVNNNLRDLRNQLYLITRGSDEALALSAGIANLGQTIKQAQAQFTSWADPKNQQRVVKDLLNKLDSSFFTLLDELTIARSRRHIEQYYDLTTIGKFPKRLRPISVTTEIDLGNTFPTYDELNDDIAEYRLAQFTPSTYVLPEYREQYDIKKKAGNKGAFDQAGREEGLVGFMKVNFLKRLESSICSFQLTLERTIKRIKEIEDQIARYEEMPSEDTFIETEVIEEGSVDEEDEELTDEANIVGKRAYYLGHLRLADWKRALAKDRRQLQKLYSTATEVTADRDAKLSRLKHLIREKVASPLNAGNRKILVFTAFSDTASYLYNNLHQWAQKELGVYAALVSGGGGNRTTYAPEPKRYGHQTEFNTLLTHFSPRSKHRSQIADLPQQGEIDLLIATDCISEGQNLQDCDYLINYDIHWNPVRIIQRFGRIDRLGSTNDVIQLVNFWPTDDLNHYIKLKDRVESRMALVDLTATAEDNVLQSQPSTAEDKTNPDQPTTDTDYTELTSQLKTLVNSELSYRHQQLLRLREEVLDVDEAEDGNVSLTQFTLEDFRAELLHFLDGRRAELAEAPLGLYSIVPAPDASGRRYPELTGAQRQLVQPGVVFCLRQRNTATKPRRGEAGTTVNPTEPFCLIYIRDNGDVRYNFVHARHVLDLMRTVCHGRQVPYESLCELFDQQTNHGQDLKIYSDLLKKSTGAIRRELRKRTGRSLQLSSNTLLAPIAASTSDAAADTPEEAFDLITWLIIR